MARYGQTLARLGAGYSMFGALVWLLWPSDTSFVNNPEAWFTLGTVTIIWHLTEFKLSEELTPRTTSLNDIRVGRELIELHAGELRYLLKDTDLWTFVDDEVYSRLGSLCDRWQRGTFCFTNRKMNAELSSLMERLLALRLKIANDTVPEMISGKLRTGYKPFYLVSQEEYDRRDNESKKANEIASQAWVLLDLIAERIKKRIPEVLNDPVS